MSRKNISPNAMKAFENYKEELANELGVNISKKKTNVVEKLVDEAEESYTNLGRS